MTIDATSGAPDQTRPKLFVQIESGAPCRGADAIVLAADRALDQGIAGCGPGVVLLWSPGQPAPQGAGLCAAEGGLEAAAALACERAPLHVVPRAEVTLGTSRFSFVPADPGEGFSTYRLDPASVAEFLVVEDGGETRLAHWLERAAELGFDEVWLHGVDAAGARRGFAIELLRKARRLAPGIAVWLSGGGCTLSHFGRLAAEDGVAAVVASEADLAELGAEEIAAALSTPRLTAKAGAT
jgi:hypothetical protein